MDQRLLVEESFEVMNRSSPPAPAHLRRVASHVGRRSPSAGSHAEGRAQLDRLADVIAEEFRSAHPPPTPVPGHAKPDVDL
eukprot:886603-Rhodomonas_salina.2